MFYNSEALKECNRVDCHSVLGSDPAFSTNSKKTPGFGKRDSIVKPRVMLDLTASLKDGSGFKEKKKSCS